MRLINSTIIDIPNGTASFFLNVTKSLLDENCEVLAILPAKNKVIIDQLKKINNKNLKIATISKYKIITFFQILKNIIIFKPDFFLNHDYNSAFFYIVKLFKIPIICSIFGTGEIKFYKFKRLIDVLLVAKKHQKKAIEEYDKTLKMLYFPYCTEFKEKIIKNKNTDIFTLGCLGTIEGIKGFNELILACDILNKKNNIKFQLLIGGNGVEKQKLEKLVKDNNLQNICKFVGFVKNKDEFYNKLDLFCFTSYKEDIGLVVSEAISYKIPIIGNNIGFVSDVLDDNDLIKIYAEDIKTPEQYFKKGKYIKAWFELKNSNYRFRTEPLNPYMLAEKIEYAINNYNEMLNKAENAYSKVKNNYSIDVSVKKLLKFLKNRYKL